MQEVKQIRGRNMFLLTAAIEGLESSPGCGWVTSAPKIIVGVSLRRGILLFRASSNTVFRPPAYWHNWLISRELNLPQWFRILNWDCDGSNLHINFQRNIFQVLRTTLSCLLGLTALRNYPKFSFAYSFYCAFEAWKQKCMVSRERIIFTISDECQVYYHNFHWHQGEW
jgi:hypothetical protein